MIKFNKKNKKKTPLFTAKSHQFHYEIQSITNPFISVKNWNWKALKNEQAPTLEEKHVCEKSTYSLTRVNEEA